MPCFRRLMPLFTIRYDDAMSAAAMLFFAAARYVFHAMPMFAIATLRFSLR